MIGMNANQMDGHRVPDGQNIFQSIGCMVLRDSLVVNLFSWQSSVSRWEIKSIEITIKMNDWHLLFHFIFQEWIMVGRL
jgi:hypothetical protein